MQSLENTLSVELYYPELYLHGQSAQVFTRTKKLLFSDSHGGWISQIHGNRIFAMILARNNLQQNPERERLEMVSLKETQPKKAIECLKHHRSLLSSVSCLGMATVLV